MDLTEELFISNMSSSRISDLYIHIQVKRWNKSVTIQAKTRTQPYLPETHITQKDHNATRTKLNNNITQAAEVAYKQARLRIGNSTSPKSI